MFDFQPVLADGRSFPKATVGQQTLQRASCGAALA